MPDRAFRLRRVGRVAAQAMFATALGLLAGASLSIPALVTAGVGLTTLSLGIRMLRRRRRRPHVDYGSASRAA